MAASKGPRFAAREDPTLPKPWRALVDGSTGYLYFWNPLTNVTQYEKPNPDDAADAGKPISEPPRAEEKSDNVNEQDEEKQEECGDRCQWQDEEDSAKFKQEAYNIEDSTHEEQMPKEDSAKFEHEAYNIQDSTHEEEPVRDYRSSYMGSSSSAEDYRHQHEITVTGDAPNPFTTFDSTGFPPEILREVLRAGFSAPTPIQAQSWPVALQNRDIVAVAKTGSGKTLGYLIPGFIHLKRLQSDSKMGPRVLVLSPTRELATQIHEEAEKFGKSSRISSVCLYGGAPKGPQLRDLDRGADVVIATPGRLNDILEMRRVSLHQISYMVLDEADRMLDMGFEPQIRKIVSGIPPRRQTLMFTATWPKEVRKIAADLLVNPVQVNIGNIDELVANKSITQYIEVITPMEKRRRLEQILRTQEPNSKIIVFCATKRMCDQLARILTDQFVAAAIHGDKSQVERDSILSQFRNGRSPVLVATDVAARGLDVKDIRYASDLVKILEGAGQQVPPELRNLVSRGGGGGGGYGGGGRSRRWSSDSGGSYGGGGSRYGGDGNGGSKYGASSGYGGSYGGGGGSRYGGDSSGNVASNDGGTSNDGRDGYGDNKSDQTRIDDGPVWSHDRLMAAGASASQRLNSGTWASDNGSRRSPSPTVGGSSW